MERRRRKGGGTERDRGSERERERGGVRGVVQTERVGRFLWLGQQKGELRTGEPTFNTRITESRKSI